MFFCARHFHFSLDFGTFGIILKLFPVLAGLISRERIKTEPV